MADRINVIEGFFSDIFHGRFPNYWRERGLSALWKYKRGVFMAKALFRLVLIAGIVALVMYWSGNL